jgi:iron complex outermembrane receptor protein
MHMETLGLEANLEYEAGDRGAFLRRFDAFYSLLDSDRESGALESKYLLDHHRHQFIFGLEHGSPFGAVFGRAARYEERLEGAAVFLLDLRFRYRTGPAEWFLDGTNIRDQEHSEVAGVPMPGRWLSAGVRAEF